MIVLSADEADVIVPRIAKHIGLSKQQAALLKPLLTEVAPTATRMHETLRATSTRTSDPDSKLFDVVLCNLRRRLRGTAIIDTLSADGIHLGRGCPAIGYALEPNSRTRLVAIGRGVNVGAPSP